MANLAANLEAAAHRYPQRPAIRLHTHSLTYAQLQLQAGQVAGLLAEHGVAPGDRVGLVLPNVPDFAATYFGILRAGAVVVPMNPLLKSREIAHCLSDSGARLLLVWPDFLAEARAGAAEAPGAVVLPVGEDWPGMLQQIPVHPLVERAPDDTAVLLYTSGTTGRPKGAELTHANLTANIEVASRTLLQLTCDDVVMGCLPLFHSFGQVLALNAAVHAGACLSLLQRFDAARALQVISRDRVTVFHGVPTMYAALLANPARSGYDVSSMRLCVSGGAAMPVEVLHAFEDAFGVAILEGYGLSETSPVASFNHPDRPRKPGSIGTPIEGVRMRILRPDGSTAAIGEVGEIAVSGHNVMKGYWNNPAATAETIVDGWLRTGDLGRQDEDGYFYVVDRKKDMIIRGGYNVYPREVEEVLYEHAAVAEAAVVGRPHPELGEEVAAAVALKPGVEASSEELITFVRDRLAAYKYPRQIMIVETLPKTPTGKILRREVQTWMR